MDSEKTFKAALRRLYDKGNRRIKANVLADELWPDCRSQNSNGQVFNLAAGVAGRMLRRYRGAFEVSKGVWEIDPEFLPADGDADFPDVVESYFCRDVSMADFVEGV